MAEKTARAPEDPARLRGDEAELFERYHHRLLGSVGWSVHGGDPALIEDACAFAWQQLIRHQPERTDRLYAWLRKVAIREALLLQRRERREAAPEGPDGIAFGELEPARLDCELAFEAGEALRALAALRPRERRYLTLQLAGLSYREIAEHCGVSYTNTNKHLARGRARLRALAESAEEVSPMTIGTCRTEGCEEPRRVRRGMIEPFCERCYRAARERVSRALAEEEAAREGAKRYRRFSLGGDKEAGPSRKAVGAEVATSAKAGRGAKARSGPRGPRMIGEELLGEVRRRYEQDGRPLGEIARELVDQTGYASARSAETALRAQFKRRGWALRSRKQAGALLRRRRTEEAHEGLERAA